jgi:predicted hydrocarbon binding protein
MSEKKSLQISTQLTEVIIKGMQEFIGQPELDDILSKCSEIPYRSCDQMLQAGAVMDYSQVSALQQAVEEVYGPQGARGVALRSGRSAFCYFLKTFGEKTGLRELDFRLLPPRRRLKTGLERLAHVMNAETGGEVIIQDDEDAWLVRIGRCPECWKKQSEATHCFFSVGLLQEFISWLSGGKIYLVEEIACRAKGDPACIIRIDKKPLD